MAAAASAGSSSAAAARRIAREILAEGRFHKASVPRPLHDVLRQIGRVLESPLSALGELVDKLGGAVPGGSSAIWGLLALAALLTSAALALRGTRRALREQHVSGQDAHPNAGPASASQLERQALAAERDGRYTEAVRLRFRAGLLRLAEKDLLSDPRSALNAEVARAIGPSAFPQLAERFDAIAYGGSAATGEDVRSSREIWARLLREVRSP